MIIDNITDFIVSIGTEALKENGEIKYNEKRIRSELVNYVQNEFNTFEHMNRDSEIDFGNLQTYMTGNLLRDFRMSLFGDMNEREQILNDIRNRLYYYTDADTKQKKKYVDKVINTAFSIIKNFYETQLIKTENMYLANKIIDDIHKDLSSCRQNPNISMVQHGEKNQQIGQVSELTINNY